MIPLFVLLVSYVVFRMAGMAIPYFAHWQHALRAALGVMFLFTASAHWGKLRPDLIRMVPSAFGNAGTWVTLTGIAEILIAAGLQIPPIATAVAALAVILLICLLPANIKAAHERLTIGDRPVPGIGVRLAIQAIFLTALVISVWPI
jgi:uncharacterized membrane protein